MAIIIGSLTTTGIDGTISAQWGVQAQINRLWQLGDWDPYKTVVTKVETISLTTYAGSVGYVNLAPASSCANSTATIDVSIVPATCGASIQGLTGSFYLTNYSYSKGDAIGIGQESWSGQRWPGGGSGGINTEYTDAPTYVLQGPSEGSSSGDVADTGIEFNAGAAQIEGTQGSVSAGFPGIGQADTTIYGIVSRIGGGTLKEDGKIGQGNASIPHQPLYIG